MKLLAPAMPPQPHWTEQAQVSSVPRSSGCLLLLDGNRPGVHCSSKSGKGSHQVTIASETKSTTMTYKEAGVHTHHESILSMRSPVVVPCRSYVQFFASYSWSKKDPKLGSSRERFLQWCDCSPGLRPGRFSAALTLGSSESERKNTLLPPILCVFAKIVAST
jgi:hypothetical protein